MKQTDYKALLIKYMRHVRDREGNDLIDCGYRLSKADSNQLKQILDSSDMVLNAKVESDYD